MEIFYTLSDINNYPVLLDQSLQTLKGKINNDKVHIAYTKPVNQKHFSKLKDQGYQIEIKEPPIEWRFSVKTLIGNLDCENAVFLDCDILINKDISELLKYRYRFAGRVGTGYYQEPFDHQLWLKNFQKFNLTPIPMINAGFLIFRDGLHRQIKDDWLNFLKMYVNKELKPPAGPRGNEQYALTLAVRKHLRESDIWFLGPREHAFGWCSESENAYVYHKYTETN